MILFSKNIESEPQKKMLSLYQKARESNQKNIEAASLSTISSENTPHCRFINIKYVNENEFIFFSNYNSPKACDINYNPRVALTFFWRDTKKISNKIFLSKSCKILNIILSNRKK